MPTGSNVEAIIIAMLDMTIERPNGYQIRTDATKTLLLAAAEEVFVQEGYESAQLDTIAKVANRSKGAIYAHYRSKEDLFLALYEDRTRRQLAVLVDRLRRSRSHAKALEEFKSYLIEMTRDRTWPLLTLEFKLYCVRHPEAKKRWLGLTELVSSLGREAIEANLFTELTTQNLISFDLKRVAIVPLLCSMTLESYFQPELLSENRLAALLGRLLDIILEDLA